MFSLTFVLLLPVLQSIVSAYSNPNPCSGSCNTHDPSLIQRASDGKWFVFSTGGHVGIATADNLDGPWTAAGQALSADSIISNSGSNDLWVSFYTHDAYVCALTPISYRHQMLPTSAVRS